MCLCRSEKEKLSEDDSEDDSTEKLSRKLLLGLISIFNFPEDQEISSQLKYIYSDSSILKILRMKLIRYIINRTESHVQYYYWQHIKSSKYSS